MTTAPTTGSSRLDTTPHSRVALRRVAAGGAVATAVNIALWVGGKAAGVSFETPRALTPEVDVYSVSLATPVMFALAAWLLVRAARRSRESVRRILVIAGVITVTSALAPVLTAGDAATAVLLAAMHLQAGTAFVLTARAATE